MKHLTSSLLFFLATLLVPALWCQSLLSDNVKKMVVFIYSAKGDGTADMEQPSGTGFLILAPAKGQAVTKMPDGSYNTTGRLFLFTARHMVDPAWACGTKPISRFYARVNLRNYRPDKDATGVAYVPIDLIKEGVKQYLVRDNDDLVDGAAIDVSSSFSPTKYDIQPMILSVFATSEEAAKLHEGDDIFSAGLIPDLPGRKRNYPFFKFGNISSITNEPISPRCGVKERPTRVWFVGINLVAGNSGSPIFYLPTPMCVGTSVCRSMLIGIQSQSLPGADIAGMTPIGDVFAILERDFGDELNLYRGEEDKRPK
jgi:hypothetical protein